MIELTEVQQQAVRSGQPVRVAAPDLGGEVVLLGAAAYQQICELLEDAQLQEGWLDAVEEARSAWIQENADEP